MNSRDVAGVTRAAFFAALLFRAALAAAQETEPAPVSFSGFGTLGVVHSDARGAQFTSTAFKPRGAGEGQPWSMEVDSVLALQATATLAPRLSAVLQVVSEQNYDRTYRPHVEWANLKYQVSPDFSVRAGRIVVPILLVTDTRNVGYTHAWVRPPGEVYALLPVTNSDGVDASYRGTFGDFVNTATLTAGRSTPRFPGYSGAGATKALGRRVATFADSIEYGHALVRLSYGRARITLPATQPLFDAFRQFGPQGAAIADRYQVRDLPLTFLGIGASYDPGRWFLMAEWAGFKANDLLGPKSAWYASCGYRYGQVTAFGSYASARANVFFDPGLPVEGLPPAFAGAATALNNGLNSILARNIAQDTVTVGARWDWSKNFSSTLQYDHTRVRPGSNGSLYNLEPGFRTGSTFGVFSATVDFVF